MRNPAGGDVWKVWLYAAASVTLGARLSNLLYNAGQALAEISSNKILNGPLTVLAGVCRTAKFPQYYEAALWLAAAALFFPWLEWLHLRRGEAAPAGSGSWWLRQLGGGREMTRGQPLRKNPRWVRQAGAGFLLAAGLLLALGMIHSPAGCGMAGGVSRGMAVTALKILAGSLAMAVVLEAFFRGIALGVFLQAMRPAAAVGMSAVFFALVLSTVPPPGLDVADPEAAGTGFEMLRLLAWRFADWRSVCGTVAPLLALGFVLSYARWRTASLWLPCGLHAGWFFARALPCPVTAAAANPGGHVPDLSGSAPVQGILSLVALLIAGVLTHFLTARKPDDESPART